MKELSPETRRVLQLARHEDDPTPEVQTRVEKSLHRRVALTLAAVGSGAAVAKPAVGAGLLATAIKSATVVGVTCGAILVGYEMMEPTADGGSVPAVSNTGAGGVTRKQGTRAPQPPKARQIAESAPRQNTETSEQTAEPAKRRAEQAVTDGATSKRDQVSRVAPRSAVLDKPGPVSGQESIRGGSAKELLAAKPDRLAEEVRALREAQRALRSGKSQRALTLLEEQQARYGSGALGQERSAARVLALCQAGKRVEARQAEAQFEARFPRSPLLGRVRGACGN